MIVKAYKEYLEDQARILIDKPGDLTKKEMFELGMISVAEGFMDAAFVVGSYVILGASVLAIQSKFKSK